MHPALVVALTVLAVVVAEMVILLIIGKGSLARLGLGWRALVGVLGDPETAARVEPALIPPPPPPPTPPGPSPEPLRLLTLLQREARVLDFFLEDIHGASDDQIGAAVRELHGKAQGAIREHLVLEPILGQEEESSVEVPAGFSPWAIQLTGNVSGQPPFRGILKHHGWRVKDIRLPAPAEGQDELVVAPAVVDLP